MVAIKRFFQLNLFKVCSTCKKNTAFTEYSKCSKRWTGIGSVCRACNQQRLKTRYWQNPEESRKSASEWVKANREKHNESNRNWEKKNPEKAKEMRRKKLQNVNVRIKMRISHVINEALKRAGTNKKTRAVTYLGCSVVEFKEHIESQFKDGMTWENIQLDHIRPCASFNLMDPDDQMICFNYKNIQPMFAKENQSKGSLYNGIRHKFKRGA